MVVQWKWPNRHGTMAHMEREQAMTELLEALADVRAQEQRLVRLAVTFYEAVKAGEKQVELVRTTGYTRESVRRMVEDEKIRRGEMQPTKRYLRDQERKRRRAAQAGRPVAES
jgi:rubrerythrin